MISKWIQIEFASTDIRAVDAIYDIRKAADAAGLNLFSRHGVQLQYPMPTENDTVVVEVKIPENAAKDFAVGNHLRGISKYLLKECGGRYDQYVVGKRLLNYIELSQQPAKEEAIPMIDRLESVAKFARLLQRTDPEAQELVRKINKIMEGVDQ